MRIIDVLHSGITTGVVRSGVILERLKSVPELKFLAPLRNCKKCARSQILTWEGSIKRPRMTNRVGWNEDKQSAVRAKEVE